MSGEAHTDPKVGLLLQGRYRILRKLGEGGMGAVYEARHELINRHLAIKTLHTQLTSSQEVVERFHREANAATLVGNEHIIEVTDFGAFDDGSPYIVMEYLQGTELGELLDEVGTLPVGRLVHIMRQACDALSAAHAQGIIHRDIKPENIYLIKRGGDPDFVKVLDFGISKMRESGEDLSSGLTKTGMALGTPYYMPPEQAQGIKDIDQRADVYALGVILYQALTGRLPFDADSYPALMVKIMTEPVVPPRQLREDISPELESVVLKAMARNRDDRYATAYQLSEALTPFRGIMQEPIMLASTRPSTGQETTPFTFSDQPQRETAVTSVPAPDTGLAKVAILAGAGLTAAALATVVWVVAGDRSAREAQAPPAAVAVPAPSPAAPAPTPTPAAEPQASPTPAPAPRPAEVQVKIRAVPADARIYIGDTEFPNPTDAWRPRSLEPVRIRVEAKGHRAVEQLAIFDQDRELAFELEKGRGVQKLSQVGGTPEPAAQNRPSPAKPAAPKAPRESPTPKPSADPKPATNDGIYAGPSGTIREEF